MLRVADIISWRELGGSTEQRTSTGIDAVLSDESAFTSFIVDFISTNEKAIVLTLLGGGTVLCSKVGWVFCCTLFYTLVCSVIIFVGEIYLRGEANAFLSALRLTFQSSWIVNVRDVSTSVGANGIRQL